MKRKFESILRLSLFALFVRIGQLKTVLVYGILGQQKTVYQSEKMLYTWGGGKSVER